MKLASLSLSLCASVLLGFAAQARAGNVEVFDASGFFNGGLALGGGVSINESTGAILSADFSVSGQPAFYNLNSVAGISSSYSDYTFTAPSSEVVPGIQLPSLSLILPSSLAGYKGGKITPSANGTIPGGFPVTYQSGLATLYQPGSENLLAGTLKDAGSLPAFSVTAALGGPLSLSGGYTSILVTATPTGRTTLAQAAAALGYVHGLDWVQIITSAPQPIPAGLQQYGNPKPITAPFYDAPPGGYVQSPSYDPYPFYYPASNLSTYYTASGVPIETATSLNLSDNPSDPCLIGGDPVACGAKPTAVGTLTFTDELVGVLSCSTPGVGACSVEGTTASAPISFLYENRPETSFQWTDNFNGTTSGGAALASLIPVNPDSGTGGITILSPASAAPEPETWLMMIIGVLITSVMLRWRLLRRLGSELCDIEIKNI